MIQAAREDGGKARSGLSRDPEVTEVVGGRTAGCYRGRVTVVTRVPQFIISILVTFIVLVEICVIFTQFLKNCHIYNNFLLSDFDQF